MDQYIYSLDATFSHISLHQILGSTYPNSKECERTALLWATSSTNRTREAYRYHPSVISPSSPRSPSFSHRSKCWQDIFVCHCTAPICCQESPWSHGTLYSYHMFGGLFQFVSSIIVAIARVIFEFNYYIINHNYNFYFILRLVFTLNSVSIYSAVILGSIALTYFLGYFFIHYFIYLSGFANFMNLNFATFF